MSEQTVQFLLRIPASVKAKIEEAAKHNNRSTNAEAIVRLEASFHPSEAEYDAATKQAAKYLRDATNSLFKELVDSLVEDGIEPQKIKNTFKKIVKERDKPED